MTTDLALFPIPGCVTFPGTIMPLHVFEPRYRAMVKHCVDNKMLMGVCHTQKVVRPKKDGQTLDESLASNQATYKPHQVFSAGECELVETLDDGRLFIRVHMAERFVLSREVQSLPFSIYQCESYCDVPLREEEVERLQLTKEKILKRLTVITNDIPEVFSIVTSDEWREKDPVDFAFSLFSVLNFNVEVQQEILEMKSPLERLNLTLNIINHN